VDSSGNTLEESIRDGLVVTLAESPDQAARMLLADVVAKRDLVLDFSLVTVDRAIASPANLRRLVLELTGYPSDLPLPEGPGQTATRPASDRVRFTIISPLRQLSLAPLSPADIGHYLSSTPRINAAHPDIVARQKVILAGSISLDDSVARLVRWVAEHLEDTVLDSQSALEALQLRKGNCQSHARLYVALARAAGIPSRIVSGLVYVQGKGFLYHSWAESYAGGWLAIDPTFAQVPADITHIRLVEGEEADDMTPLANIIGKIKGKIIELEQGE
jgi:transglutaminase-like putative cysteine protease